MCVSRLWRAVVPFTGCRTPPLLYYIAAPPPLHRVGTSFGGGVHPKCVALAPAARWCILTHPIARSLTLPNSVSVHHLSPSLRHSIIYHRVDPVPPRVSAVREIRPSPPRQQKPRADEEQQNGAPRDSIPRPS